MRLHAETIRRLRVGVAFILPSSVSRGMLCAILWMQPLPAPYKVLATEAEGRAWCEERLHEVGVALQRPTAPTPSGTPEAAPQHWTVALSMFVSNGRPMWTTSVGAPSGPASPQGTQPPR